MLILFVINKIKSVHGNSFINRHWKHSYPLENVTNNDLMTLKEDNEELFIDVLRITGFVDESF